MLACNAFLRRAVFRGKTIASFGQIFFKAMQVEFGGVYGRFEGAACVADLDLRNAGHPFCNGVCAVCTTCAGHSA